MEYLARLERALTDLGIPVHGVSDGSPPRVDYRAEATPAQRTQGDALATAFDKVPRQPRKLRAIVADLDALSGAQKSAIWTNLSGGSPPRWTLSDDGTVWACLRTAARVADPLQTELRLLAVAKYVRDEHPTYLVNPSFAPGINVPGDEPVTA